MMSYFGNQFDQMTEDGEENMWHCASDFQLCHVALLLGILNLSLRFRVEKFCDIGPLCALNFQTSGI